MHFLVCHLLHKVQLVLVLIFLNFLDLKVPKYRRHEESKLVYCEVRQTNLNIGEFFAEDECLQCS